MLYIVTYSALQSDEHLQKDRNGSLNHTKIEILRQLSDHKHVVPNHDFFQWIVASCIILGLVISPNTCLDFGFTLDMMSLDGQANMRVGLLGKC